MLVKCVVWSWGNRAPNQPCPARFPSSPPAPPWQVLCACSSLSLPTHHPPVLAGTYRVLKLLGSGAEGEAYLVDDQEGKSWALKLIKLPLPKGCLQSIVREIQLQSELGEGHNNIIGMNHMWRGARGTSSTHQGG